MNSNRFFLFFVTFFLAVQPVRADLCADLKGACAKVRSYQCTYRAVTSHQGKIDENLMRYSFEQPQKIRMDIEKPSKGAVLLYNTEVTAKVRVRPFPKMRFFVLEYPLAHKRVSSDSGGTVDRSDLQSRVEALCGKIEALTSKERQQVQSDAALVKDGVFSVSLPEDGGVRRWVFNAKSFLLERIEVLGPAGEVKERFTWEGLKVNPEFSKNFFKEFQ